MKKTTRSFGRLLAAAGVAVTLGLAPLAHADEAVAVKNALYGAGYDITNVSSGMDDKTRAALTRFQKDHGLEATGALNDETRKALGMITVQVAAAAPAQVESQDATAKASSNASAQPAEKSGEKDAIEEDDDGGWSLW
ncbi:peptidoglycan-binding domain-containing protein [Marinobacter sp. DUT-1]|uniref:peptidoglycan-binding domain-containing protein n=1 Tax=Marinobacter sp. DUT-1 TaxID=3412037 RepID=UPI003D1856A6